MAIAFHDVVDRREERMEDAVTTQSLVSFFDFLVADGWTAVSLDQVAAARAGGAPLPDKAVLLTFDDGYRSMYERVYPLLLAYRMPAVAAVVTSWLDVPANGVVDYGGKPMPRSAFLTWDEVRQMQASGLVEIASHSHDLHRVVLMNAEGNTAPAARTWRYDPATGQIEDDTAHRNRVASDLSISRARIAAETGRPPRALVWPFGRFSGPAVAAAEGAGFTMALTLEPEAADARQAMALHRYYPTRDPDLGTIMFNLRFAPPRRETVRLACIDPARFLTADDPAARDAVLGDLIEQVRLLGATGVILPVVDGAGVPLNGNSFGRLARQLGTRAGVEVYGGLDQAVLDQLGGSRAAELLAAATRAAPIDGFVLPAAAGMLAQAPQRASSPADRRLARTGADHALLRLFHPALTLDPRLELILAGFGTPPAFADRQILPAPEQQLKALGWRAPEHSGRIVELLSGTPDAIGQQVQRLQREGASGFALCPWHSDQASVLAPAFSSATFPWRP
ncbi:poly-beta-1,6-N-acetyl-D-glucosamine N-deacetylase PgaB [Erythrobacter sp. T5W1-R]|uniref:poly-beta-1,6-N-acetyl-D-glucosamine N-deacetylase PgaB n=1 Tax=Erythrobacter sp. T5W1-R TaxID=3101752 RepID=UPI002AFDD57C|nr:poly-beta-1,6-N-acetyl-D-glucosamine N-deacetylase PgaB [Erythrobacter sp. T5W1-R]MEA1619943.1 poly-beta-1,6-N-acetyl-D-glucosamine N-deacetylase PgaB [Erythrobacter sp. T5W1-R]